MFIVSKCIKYYIKRLAKVSSIVVIGLLMIASFIYIKYKPLYKVTLNGEVIGYVTNKKQMQEKIDAFVNNLEGNITSINPKAMPEYELELVSTVKENETNEVEVLAAVKNNSEIKCRVYAIKLDGNIKAFVTSQEEANQVVENIKGTIIEGVSVNLEVEEQEQDKAQADLNTSSIEIAQVAINQDVEVKVQEYQKQKEEEARAEKLRQQQEASRKAALAREAQLAVSSRAGASAPVTTSGQFMRPLTSGTITSKYGRRSSGFHTGLDLAAPKGTPIYASDAGTVVYSGSRGGYGYMIIIDHGNGYQTYYAHCSALYVSSGATVSKGQNIAAVGSTGNSTGPHLHFEIRLNGSTLNPQNYI